MNSQQFKQWCQRMVPYPVTPDYLHQPLIMAILNVTPDSFSDGGRFLDASHAFQHAMSMIAQGADVIDIGGESSRPGADPISIDEELTRVIPVIEQIRAESDVCISIDTYKAEVMQEAVNAGASLINDIMALRSINALTTAASLKVPVCLMHMQGMPKSMQNAPIYQEGIIEEINDFFQQRVEACLNAGIAREHILLDPGFGFGKSVRHNMRLVKQLTDFRKHQQPLLLGVSRKSTIGAVLNKPVAKRLTGSIAVAVFAALQGISIIRTHDVEETKQALVMLDTIQTACR
ncbi:dihydropteroate synthase [Legionella nagasakiensis]|uniref:dihydropteroate synthase n=1 Tax=Legionella nagasakiensis TaxID=535290 RepID=UPI001F5EBC0C|nr:dihydropteroate synthase [Legionella nagasakiensis]